MTKIDIRLSLNELYEIEDYLCSQLEKLHGEDTKIKPYDSIASLCDLINDVVHAKELEQK